MTQTYFPFDAGAGANVTEDQWRAMAAHWLRTGVIVGEDNELRVYGDNSGMQVKTQAGKANIRGHYYANDAEVTSAIAAADPANPRIDRLIVRADFTGNTIALAVLQGVAAASPTAPALTQSTTTWEISLAQIAVAAGTGSITAANVTDERDFVGADPQVKRENLLANRGFELAGWQRGTSFAAMANGQYGPDRWEFGKVGTDTLTVAREATIKLANSLYSCKLTFVLGTGAGASRWRTKLAIADGWESLLGKPNSIRLPVRCDVANAVRALILTDGTGGVGSPSGYHPGNSQWADLLVQNVVIPLDATYVYVGITLQASATVYLDNCVLNEGPVAGIYRAGQPQQPVVGLQRYYEKSFPIATAPAAARGLAALGVFHSIMPSGIIYRRVPVSFAVQKYATPTLTTYSPGAGGAAGQVWVQDIAGGNAANVAAVTSNTSDHSFVVGTNLLALTNAEMYFDWVAEVNP